jgi:hypothetical protein
MHAHTSAAAREPPVDKYRGGGQAVVAARSAFRWLAGRFRRCAGPAAQLGSLRSALHGDPTEPEKRALRDGGETRCYWVIEKVYKMRSGRPKATVIGMLARKSRKF